MVKTSLGIDILAVLPLASNATSAVLAEMIAPVIIARTASKYFRIAIFSSGSASRQEEKLKGCLSASLAFPACNADSEPTTLAIHCTLLLPNPLERRSAETVVPTSSFGVVPSNRRPKNAGAAMAQHAAPIYVKRDNRSAAKRIANKAMSRCARATPMKR